MRGSWRGQSHLTTNQARRRDAFYAAEQRLIDTLTDPIAGAGMSKTQALKIIGLGKSSLFYRTRPRPPVGNPTI